MNSLELWPICVFIMFTEREEVEIRKTIESYFDDKLRCPDRIWYFQKPFDFKLIGTEKEST